MMDVCRLIQSLWLCSAQTRNHQIFMANHFDVFVLTCTDNSTEKTYIMMEARLGVLFKSESEYTVLDR